MRLMPRPRNCRGVCSRLCACVTAPCGSFRCTRSRHISGRNLLLLGVPACSPAPSGPRSLCARSSRVRAVLCPRATARSSAPRPPSLLPLRRRIRRRAFSDKAPAPARHRRRGRPRWFHWHSERGVPAPRCLPAPGTGAPRSSSPSFAYFALAEELHLQMRVCGQRLAPSSASILVSPCMLIAVTAGSLAHRYGSQIQQPEPPGPAAARGMAIWSTSSCLPFLSRHD